MPIIKPQHLKALSTIHQQPVRMTPRVKNIIYLDLAGRTNNDIAEMTGLTPARVSTIKNCPMYTQQRKVISAELERQVVEKQSDKVVHGDPVERVFEDRKVQLAQKLVDIALDSESDAVSARACVDGLGYVGYKPRTHTSVTSVEISAEMQENWDRVMSNDKYSKAERVRKVRIKTEMSE